MDLRLAEISTAASPGAPAAPVPDGAGWPVSGKPVVPDNITLVELPPSAPDADPIEDVGAEGCLRGTTLAHRLLKTCDGILTARCDPWNTFIADGETVRSVATRRWATCQIPSGPMSEAE